ncbi:MAG: preprotein translocase subunit SecG [Bacillota bacterium]
MAKLEIALQIVHAILALGVVAGVLLQPGKSAGMPGAIAGGAQTFFGKKKGLDEKLARVTTAFAILFMISSVVLAFVVGR